MEVASYKSGIFEDWVPQWLRIIVVFSMNIPISMVMGTYMGILPILVGETGNIQEVFSAANYASFGGIAIALPVYLGVRRMFKPKTVLVFAYSSIVLFLYVATITTSPVVIVLIGFLCGVIRMLGAFQLVGVIMPILAPNQEDYIKYTFFYPMVLACSQLGNYVVSSFAFRYDWKFGYYMIMALQLIPLILTLIFVHGQKTTRKIKFYMFDWFSFILSSLVMIVWVYVMVFGKVKDWLDAPEIIFGFGVLPLLLYLLFWRSTSLKRPFLSIKVFKNKYFHYAVMFMFLICLFYSSSGLQTTFYSGLLKYNVETQAALNLWLMPGIILGAALAYWWFKHENNFKGIYLLAVSFYMVSHILLYFLINPYIDRNQLITPLFFRGLGMGISYIAIATYAKIGFQSQAEKMGGIFWLILVRSLIGPLFFGTLYSNVLSHRIADFSNRLLSKVDFYQPELYAQYSAVYESAMRKGSDSWVAEQLASQNLYVGIQTEATMLALQYIFGGVIIAGIFLIALTLAVRPPHINKRKVVKWRRVWRGDEWVWTREK